MGDGQRLRRTDEIAFEEELTDQALNLTKVGKPVTKNHRPAEMKKEDRDNIQIAISFKILSNFKQLLY